MWLLPLLYLKLCFIIEQFYFVDDLLGRLAPPTLPTPPFKAAAAAFPWVIGNRTSSVASEQHMEMEHQKRRGQSDVNLICETRPSYHSLLCDFSSCYPQNAGLTCAVSSRVNVVVKQGVFLSAHMSSVEPLGKVEVCRHGERNHVSLR